MANFFYERAKKRTWRYLRGIIRFVIEIDTEHLPIVETSLGRTEIKKTEHWWG
jgi:hypothetical protein